MLAWLKATKTLCGQTNVHSKLVFVINTASYLHPVVQRSETETCHSVCLFDLPAEFKRWDLIALIQSDTKRD